MNAPIMAMVYLIHGKRVAPMTKEEPSIHAKPERLPMIIRFFVREPTSLISFVWRLLFVRFPELSPYKLISSFWKTCTPIRAKSCRLVIVGPCQSTRCMWSPNQIWRSKSIRYFDRSFYNCGRCNYWEAKEMLLSWSWVGGMPLLFFKWKL